jgi:hypothetical protein
MWVAVIIIGLVAAATAGWTYGVLRLWNGESIPAKAHAFVIRMFIVLGIVIVVMWAVAIKELFY